VRHALEAAKAVDFPMQTFGGTKNFLPQALAAWEGGAEAEEARREADARVDEQRRRERDERERRRRLADRHAALADEALEALRHRAEAALAADGVDRTRLGYDVLVKLKVDEFLEREYLPTAGGGDRTPAERAAMECSEAEIVPGDGGGHIAR
jgi:phosphoglycolate phosphatase-like HAD superfamily hydrolase